MLNALHGTLVGLLIHLGKPPALPGRLTEFEDSGSVLLLKFLGVFEP
jgi:hypothetical protein